MTVLEHWMIWLQKCALELCPPDAQCDLSTFARARFARFIRIYKSTTNVTNAQSLIPEQGEIWHLFETYLRIQNTKAGKSYKQWLWARSNGDYTALRTIESGATLLMRNVVKEYLRIEFSDCRLTSMDQSFGSDIDASVSLNDLLPDDADPVREVARREAESIAEKESADFLDKLSHDERIVLLARELGLPLTHPIIGAMAGCRKSSLSRAYYRTLKKITDYVHEKHSGEEPESQYLILIQIYEQIKKRIISWGRREKGCEEIFNIMESKDSCD